MYDVCDSMCVMLNKSESEVLSFAHENHGYMYLNTLCYWMPDEK